jgi:hypothetical protein
MAEKISWMEQLMADAAEAKRSSARGERNRWALGGQNSIVPPGGSEIVRIMPHWTIIDKFLMRNGKLVANPQYGGDKPFWMKLSEHFWESDGKWQHDWCPTSLDPKAPCFLCEESKRLNKAADKADRDLAWRMRPKLVYLTVAAAGKLGARRTTDDGKVDLRLLPLSQQLLWMIGDIANDPAHPEFSRGDITDPRTGYDLRLTRPAANEKAPRWSIKEAPNPCPMYAENEKAAFTVDGGWVRRILHMEEIVASELRTAEEQEAAMYGDGDAEAGPEAGTTDDPWAAGNGSVAQAGAPEDEHVAPAPVDDPFLASPDDTPTAPTAGGEAPIEDWFAGEPPAAAKPPQQAAAAAAPAARGGAGGRRPGRR